MALTVDHIQTIVAAVDAGWSPAELIADMHSGLDHFGLASINVPELQAPEPAEILQLPSFVVEEVSAPIPMSGFYNAMGLFEPDHDEVSSTALIF